MKKTRGCIEKAKGEGKLRAGGEVRDTEGFYVEPTVIGGLAPDATISQEEIFGPGLAVTRAKDFNDALRIANNTQFGLTGAVFTDDESKLDRAREEIFVGNL